MHKETVKSEISAVLVMLMSVGGIFALIIATNLLIANRLLHDIALIVSVGLWLWFLIRRFLCVYEYIATDTELIFCRNLAGRETEMLRIGMDELTCIYPEQSQEIRMHRAKHTHRLYVITRDSRYALIFHRDGSYCKVIFSPTAEFADLIREKFDR